MNLYRPCSLDSGLEAQFMRDRIIDNSLVLFIDETPQSHINLVDPANVFFEYIKRMAAVCDAFTTPGKPISALHLGGGAYTLPRYIEATRPKSIQQIIELDTKLISYVREVAPLPKRAKIRVRSGDAREKLANLPRGMHNNIDIAVVDVFSGSSTPKHLVTKEFYTEITNFMNQQSILLINSATGKGPHTQGGSWKTFLQRHLATLQSIFENIAAVAHVQTLTGKVFGNTVLLASNTDLKSWQKIISALQAAGPHPAKILQGKELTQFVAQSSPLLDEDGIEPPIPPKKVF